MFALSRSADGREHLIAKMIAALVFAAAEEDVLEYFHAVHLVLVRGESLHAREGFQRPDFQRLVGAPRNQRFLAVRSVEALDEALVAGKRADVLEVVQIPNHNGGILRPGEQHVADHAWFLNTSGKNKWRSIWIASCSWDEVLKTTAVVLSSRCYHRLASMAEEDAIHLLLVITV